MAVCRRSIREPLLPRAGPLREGVPESSKHLADSLVASLARPETGLDGGAASHLPRLRLAP